MRRVMARALTSQRGLTSSVGEAWAGRCFGGFGVGRGMDVGNGVLSGCFKNCSIERNEDRRWCG